jgi:hypothetical protein
MVTLSSEEYSAQSPKANADSAGFVRANCPFTNVLRPRRFNTLPSIYLQIDDCAGTQLARAFNGFGEMEDAVDVVRVRVGLDVVGGDDCLHPFRQRLVFLLRERRKG